jgi:predicted TIM-barrel fold metal-dependent hydrolase
MRGKWSTKKVIGSGAVCLVLAAGCPARLPQVPAGPPAAALQARAAIERAEAAARQADAAATRAEAAAGRAEQTVQRVEVVMEQFVGRLSETFSEREVRRFRKISTHEHYRARGDIRPYLAAMEWANIEKAVFVPTAWPPSNPHYKDNLQELLALRRRYPKKIIVFATAYDKDPEAATILEEAMKQGAQGIKFIDWLASAKYPDEAGPVDSENMYRVYEIARRYRVPVLLHIDFQKRPDWKGQFERVATDFPDVTFILAHYCRAASGQTPALELCADTLDKFPHVFGDISMGGGLKRYMRYFDEDPVRWHDFVLRYQDRLLWGTDIILDGNPSKDAAWVRHRMLTDFLMFQSTLYQSPFHQNDKTLHTGLALPTSVLKKIYYENPRRLLAEKQKAPLP